MIAFFATLGLATATLLGGFQLGQNNPEAEFMDAKAVIVVDGYAERTPEHF